MSSHGSSRKQLQQKLIETICAGVPDCLSIYRFGSWDTVDERGDSDIDLALLASSPLDPMVRWDLAQKLASVAKRDVDLVDLLNASVVMRMQVVAHGERVYSADDNVVERFEDMVFSSYARLNYERRFILNDVKNRGNIYGEQ